MIRARPDRAASIVGQSPELAAPGPGAPGLAAVWQQALPVLAALAAFADRHPGRDHACKVSVDLALCRRARFALALAGARPDPAEFDPLVDRIVAELLAFARLDPAPSPGLPATLPSGRTDDHAENRQD